MIVNNYWNLRAYVDSHTYPTSSSYSSYSFGLRFKNPDNTNVMEDTSISIRTYCGDPMTPWNFYRGLFLRVGSGSSTPALQDYWMLNGSTDTDVTDSFVDYRSYYLTTSSNNKTILRFIVSGTNPTESPITITEVSICKQIAVNYTISSGYYAPYIMFVHEKLNTPITVQPRKGFHLPFDWTAS